MATKKINRNFWQTVTGSPLQQQSYSFAFLLSRKKKSANFRTLAWKSRRKPKKKVLFFRIVQTFLTAFDVKKGSWRFLPSQTFFVLLNQRKRFLAFFLLSSPQNMVTSNRYCWVKEVRRWNCVGEKKRKVKTNIFICSLWFTKTFLTPYQRAHTSPTRKICSDTYY